MNKLIQLIISIGILFLLWKGCGSILFNMENLSKWSTNSTVFWVLWGIEAIFMGWWLASEMRSTLSVGQSVYLGWAYLGLALLLFLRNFRLVALILVGIGALPLAIMALVMVLYWFISFFDGRARWN